MADLELRKRLGAAAGMAIDGDLLDMIHNRLMALDTKAKIPVTIKYNFSVDETGSLAVDISTSASMPLQAFNLRLTSDGKQLRLFADDVDDEDEDENQETEEQDNAEEQEEETVPEPAVAAEQPAPVKPGARVHTGPSASDRIAQINAQNEGLYRDKHITRQQAKQAGVDVDAIDAETAA